MNGNMGDNPALQAYLAALNNAGNVSNASTANLFGNQPFQNQGQQQQGGMFAGLMQQGVPQNQNMPDMAFRALQMQMQQRQNGANQNMMPDMNALTAFQNGSPQQQHSRQSSSTGQPQQMPFAGQQNMNMNMNAAAFLPQNLNLFQQYSQPSHTPGMTQQLQAQPQQQNMNMRGPQSQATPTPQQQLQQLQALTGFQQQPQQSQQPQQQSHQQVAQQNTNTPNPNQQYPPIPIQTALTFVKAQQFVTRGGHELSNLMQALKENVSKSLFFPPGTGPPRQIERHPLSQAERAQYQEELEKLKGRWQEASKAITQLLEKFGPADHIHAQLARVNGVQAQIQQQYQQQQQQQQQPNIDRTATPPIKPQALPQSVQASPAQANQQPMQQQSKEQPLSLQNRIPTPAEFYSALHRYLTSINFPNLPNFPAGDLPRFNNMTVDLHQIFRLIVSAGGLDLISTKNINIWPGICKSLRYVNDPNDPSPATQSVIKHVQRAYMHYVASFEKIWLQHALKGQQQQQQQQQQQGSAQQNQQGRPGQSNRPFGITQEEELVMAHYERYIISNRPQRQQLNFSEQEKVALINAFSQTQQLAQETREILPLLPRFFGGILTSQPIRDTIAICHSCREALGQMTQQQIFTYSVQELKNFQVSLSRVNTHVRGKIASNELPPPPPPQQLVQQLQQAMQQPQLQQNQNGQPAGSAPTNNAQLAESFSREALQNGLRAGLRREDLRPPPVKQRTASHAGSPMTNPSPAADSPAKTPAPDTLEPVNAASPFKAPPSPGKIQRKQSLKPKPTNKRTADQRDDVKQENEDPQAKRRREMSNAGADPEQFVENSMKALQASLVKAAETNASAPLTAANLLNLDLFGADCKPESALPPVVRDGSTINFLSAAPGFDFPVEPLIKPATQEADDVDWSFFEGVGKTKKVQPEAATPELSSMHSSPESVDILGTPVSNPKDIAAQNASKVVKDFASIFVDAEWAISAAV